MSLEQLSSRVSGPRTTLASRYRTLAFAAMTAAAAAFGLNGCSGNNGNNDNPDGGAGAAGADGGTGGVDAGGNDAGGEAGAGGEGGSDCDNFQLAALAEADFEVGQNGTVTVSGLSGTDAAYNGLELQIPDGALFTQDSRIRLEKVIYDNYGTEIGQMAEDHEPVGDVSGIRPIVVDSNQPYIDDGNGNCIPNVVAVNETVLADPLKQPIMRTPEGYFTTIFNVKENSEAVVDYGFTSDRTEFTLDSLTTVSGRSDYVLGNSLPGGTDPTSRIRLDGKLEVDATGVTDENQSSEAVLLGLSPSAPGVTFVPMSGQPGMYESSDAYSGTALDLSWSGLNEGLVNDTVTKNLAVEQPNQPPVINSLTANPNPTIPNWPSAVSFSVTEPDGDPVNWTLTIDDAPGTADQFLNPDNGSCNGLSCSGTLPAGGGTVNMTYNSGNTSSPNMTLNVNDGKGGTDMEQEMVQIN